MSESILKFKHGEVRVYDIDHNLGVCRMEPRPTGDIATLMNRENKIKVFDHIFSNLNLSKIISIVPKEDTETIASLRKGRWYEDRQAMPNHIYFYYTKELWHDERPYHTRSYTTLKRFFENRVRCRVSSERKAALVS